MHSYAEPPYSHAEPPYSCLAREGGSRHVALSCVPQERMEWERKGKASGNVRCASASRALSPRLSEHAISANCAHDLGEKHARSRRMLHKTRRKVHMISSKDAYVLGDWYMSFGAQGVASALCLVAG